MPHRKRPTKVRTITRKQAEALADIILKRFEGRPLEYAKFSVALDKMINQSRRRRF